MCEYFKFYGKFCATHPWEVIVTVLTLTSCLLTLDQNSTVKHQAPCPGCFEEQFKAVDVIVMTIIRCLAILYTSHQFRNLHKLGSKYILGIAGLFTVFSSFVFTSAVLNFLKIDLVDLKDALFFFLLLIDLSKAAILAQFALTASNQEEISDKIARGMSVLGPTITLDTIVETLVIGVGTLSGVQRLEMLSYFACLSVLVNFLIFMTFYPACLSLMLELGKVNNFYGDNQGKVTEMLLEENEKSNPAVQRVKIIMSVGLLIVHIHTRFKFNSDLDQSATNCATESSIYGYLLRQFVLSADHIVILILLVTLLVKFVYFENEETVQSQIMDSATKLATPKKTRETCTQTVNDEQTKIPESSTLSLRSLEECLQIYRSEGAENLTKAEIILLIDTKHIPSYNLERILGNNEKSVEIRRQLIENLLNIQDLNIPYKNYDYSKVLGVCCENVIGYMPVPLGICGPLVLDNKQYYIPMATTEGCLIASTNRGCRAVEKTGVKSRLLSDGMTRAPLVRFPSITSATLAKLWLEQAQNYEKVKVEFESTSRFVKLQRITVKIAARYLFVRFVAETGDAMGMNMLSKGTEKALKLMKQHFSEMEIMSISGNYCTDKKVAAVNWIEGRGKSVVCEAIIPATVVASVLRTNSHTLVDLNISKNFVGSALAGSIGGFNAHAANIVTALFIATGQDPAQNIASSNCMTIMEPWGENGQDLYISCTMPSIEIGTVGGGTNLVAQSACLKVLGVKTSPADPASAVVGNNAKQLAKIVCATVLVGELSLMAALATGQLVKSHLRYNRSCSSNSCEL